VRPSWEEYWMKMVDAAAERGTCDRGKSGAVLVDSHNNRVLSTGYVGAPRGLPHCDDVGHLIRSVTYEDGSVHHSCVRTAHAERNAIVQAACTGVAIEGATLYCTMEPCISCATDIINAKIVKVVAKFLYHGGELTREWFKVAGVELKVLNQNLATYAVAQIHK
jgi:dCMP deaminase